MPNIQEQFDGGVLSYNDITQWSLYLCPYQREAERLTFLSKAQSNARRALNQLSAICIEFGKAKRKGEV